MNIFWLDEDLDRCAQYHCDKHVVKMILESAQILCTVLHDNGIVDVPYKATHNKHPCTLWAGYSTSNYKKLFLLATKLCKEYTYRYGKVHKTELVLKELLKITNMNTELPLDDHIESRAPLAMPDEIKDMSCDVVSNYRGYYQYKYDSGMDMRWTNRDVPHWINLER